MKTDFKVYPRVIQVYINGRYVCSTCMHRTCRDAVAYVRACSVHRILPSDKVVAHFKDKS